MAERSSVTERGIVTKNKSGFLQVRIGRNSACASCGKCGMTENQKHVDFWVENTKDAEVGDVVEVTIPDKNPAPLALVAYGIPIVPSLGLLFCGLALDLPIWASMLMFFGGFALGFGIVVLIDKLRKHKWMQSPTLVSVVMRASVAKTAAVHAEEKDVAAVDTAVTEEKTDADASTEENKKDI